MKIIKSRNEREGSYQSTFLGRHVREKNVPRNHRKKISAWVMVLDMPIGKYKKRVMNNNERN